MSLDYLVLNITFNIKNQEFSIDGSVKKEKQADLIAEFLRGQIGKGADYSKPNEQDVYHITIKWHPDYDTFKVNSDTGNKGLRDGILRYMLGKLE